ncbi:hypothetical protein Xmau_02416 [Xenorhabdus mauleonii]|uniref:Uncharacterized protein n=1 Tax=Xenorhabdus mauleonii TaxID=351675 RepID=A0A1I3R9M7_9GAMM|nr:hypothetical protein Xmau_02416 [Xenorhabdus mauleonii]SFJ43344.1 hypothetical protein SAMN05421680_10951 [Xenorhabdus mauleonii]
MRRGGKGMNPRSIDNYVTGVNERSQQRGNLKDDGYKIRNNGNVNKAIWVNHPMAFNF